MCRWTGRSDSSRSCVRLSQSLTLGLLGLTAKPDHRPSSLTTSLTARTRLSLDTTILDRYRTGAARGVHVGLVCSTRYFTSKLGPASLTYTSLNRSSDDWVSYVYKQYGHMHRMRDVTVVHHMHGQRYNADDRGPRLLALNSEIAAGARTFDAWTVRVHNGLTMAHQAEEVTCC